MTKGAVEPGFGTADQWSDTHEVVDSSAIATHDVDGAPIPVTIPVNLAPGVKVVYTTRLGGVSRGGYASLNLGSKGNDDPAAVEANRRGLVRELGKPLRLVSQVHSAQVVDADGPNPLDAGMEASPGDAQVTTRTDQALGVFAADCLPVLLADPEAGVIGAAHCGRKGLMAGVIASVVDGMVSKEAVRNRIVATLGPCICPDCYQVDEELAHSFDQRFPGTAGVSRFGGASIDIAMAARMDLQEAGVSVVVDSGPRVAAATHYLKDDQELEAIRKMDDGAKQARDIRVDQAGHWLCTVENPLWFSHRRSVLAGTGDEGRMLALIMREG